MMNQSSQVNVHFDEHEDDIEKTFQSIQDTLTKKLVTIESLIEKYQAKVDKLKDQRNKINMFLASQNVHFENVTAPEKAEVMLFPIPKALETLPTKVIGQQPVDQLPYWGERAASTGDNKLDIPELIEKYFLTINKRASLFQLRDWTWKKISYAQREYVDFYYIQNILKERPDLYKRDKGGDYIYIKDSLVESKEPSKTPMPVLTKVIEYYFSRVRRSSSIQMLTNWIFETYPFVDKKKTIFNARCYLNAYKNKYRKICSGWYEYLPHVYDEQYKYPPEKVDENNKWKKSITSAVEYYFRNIARLQSLQKVTNWIQANTEYKTLSSKSVHSVLNAKKELYEKLGGGLYQYIPHVNKPYESEKPKVSIDTPST